MYRISWRCRHGRSRLYSTHTVVSLPPPSSVSSMLYDKSMLALDEGTGHIQRGVVRRGSFCTGRLSGAPPARPVRIVLARWFRCCRPIRLANALLLARVAFRRRFGSRSAGLETLWELLHPSGVRGDAVTAGSGWPDTMVSMLPPLSFLPMLYDMSKLPLDKRSGRVQRGLKRCGSYCIRRISRHCRHGWSRLYSHGGFAAAAPDLLANAL
jgi:hypothetical protein